MEDDLIDDSPIEPEKPNKGFMLSSQWYERLKWFVLIFLPALGAFYFGLSNLWPGLPSPVQVVGTISLVAVLLGTLIGISSKNFKNNGADGSIGAKIVGDNVILSKFKLPNISPEELAKKKSVTIQVNPPSQ